jgi:pyruvate, water dikinase
LPNKFIYGLEELTRNDGDLVGKKCANLGELARAGFRVPPGFALSLEAYDAFMQGTGLADEIRHFFSEFRADPADPKELGRFIEAAESVQAMVESSRMPADMASAVTGRYQALCAECGSEDVKVAVRSAGAVSHPGQYDSFLNVHGEEELLDNIKKVWSSTFNTRSLAARARKGLALDRDPIGVCVLRMVNARAAGVMFTAEPTTADVTRLTLEGSWGLGESVVSGSVTPDVWMVDRTRFTIVDRRTRPRPAPGVAQSNLVQATASGNGVEVQSGCLSDEEVIELARMGARVELHFGAPQDIEWAVDSEATDYGFYVIQTRDEKFSIRFAGF